MAIVLYYVVAFVVACGLILSTIFILRKKSDDVKNKTLKAVSLILSAMFVFRYMLGGDLIEKVTRLSGEVFNSPALTCLMLLLVWCDYATVILYELYPFYKMRYATHIAKWFASFVSLLKIFCLPLLIQAIEGAGAVSHVTLRGVLLSVEAGIMVAYSVYVWLESYKERIAKKEIFGFIAGILIVLLATMPAYMLKAIFGKVNYTIEAKSFTIPHRIILYFSFIIPVVLYFVLRKLKKEEKRGVLLFIALGTLMSFSLHHKFASFLDITAWPFHLCNTAMYIVALCLIFKWDKLFYFTYFINVLGAFLAMAMPNYSDTTNLFDTGMLVFYINHYIAFFMPLLIVALRVYERPKLREFKYSMVGFAVYFALVLILNAWFSNYGEVDYFFINSDFIADKLGKWAEDLRNIVWTFKIKDFTFTFYPLYQFLFFVVYVILGLGMWFLYEAAYSFVDTMYDIADRNKKIKLDQLALETKLAGRSKKEPVDLENKNKLVLKNFSKKYGSSNVYAVKDASLEINGGEIYGFLGHNGAGKSTIIKSIVGIQPITSGKIEVCGYDVDSQSVMAKKQIGFVPDHYALYEKLTGREYINYIADLYEVSKEDRDKAIEKYITLFELKDSFDNQIKTYSHGMKQKIAIISALVHNPRVWILDEPLTGLDPQSIFQVKECMREHARNGNIVFFSSHLIDIVEQLCDKIAIIKNGHILTTAVVKDVEKDTTLEQFYLKITEENDVKRATDSDAKKQKAITMAQRREERRKEREEEKAKKAEIKKQKAEAKAKRLAEKQAKKQKKENTKNQDK